MHVLVDTNVIADVIYKDPVWSAWSIKQLSLVSREALINPIIYAELCHRASSHAEVDELVAGFGFSYEELPKYALFLTARAFRSYRAKGGAKTSPLSDFFIGAHAEAAGYTLLTRDKARYQTYFPGVPLIIP